MFSHMSSVSRRAGILCTCFIALFPELGQARNLRERTSSEVVDSLLSELAGTLGQGSRTRISHIETQLRPMVTALPKSNNGTLTQAVARYALHRFFVQQHGWYVNGLEPSGHSSNASLPTDILKDRVPSRVLALVEQHLGGRGFGLHELAVLAATLDDLIHAESVERLRTVYAAHGVPTESIISTTMADLIIKTFMMFTLIPRPAQYAQMTSSMIISVFPQLRFRYPGWDDAMLWVKDVQMGLEYSGRIKRNPFQRVETQSMDFASVVRVVEEVGARYGRFQDLECRSLKWAMLDMDIDSGENGRVSLLNFHGKALNGFHKESTEYLRDAGALDESHPQRPSVIIPNYLSMPSNCLAASTFYSVCCIDECETLMTQVESKIVDPYGAPQDILSVISATSTDTVDSPRNLSETLVVRLNEIAAQHGGKVLLHSRLFAQWMHHAYPSECPYPQAPGQRTRTKFTESGLASEEETEMAAKMVGGSSGDETAVPVLPWSDEEELLMIFEPTNANRWWVWRTFRTFACMALVLSAWVSLRQSSKAAFSALSLLRGGPAVAEMRKSEFV